MKPVVTKLAGVMFGAQENIRKFGCADIGTFELVREPENPHDPNAIQVVIAEYFLGYVPGHIAARLAPEMDSGVKYLAEFISRNEHPAHDRIGLTVRIVEGSQNPIEEKGHLS